MPPPRRISTRFPQKTFFRVFAYGVPIGLFLLAFLAKLPDGARIALCVQALLVSGIMTLLWRWLFAGTLDAVDWEGEELVLTYRGEEERIQLADVVEVKNLRSVNPERIELTLRSPCRFGERVIFFPTYRTFPGKPHPLVAELQTAITSSGPSEPGLAPRGVSG